MTASRSSRRAGQAFQERRGAHRPPSPGFIAAVPWLIATAVVIAVVLVGGDLLHRDPAAQGAPSSTSGETTKPAAPTAPPSTQVPTPTSTGPTGEVRRELALVVLNGTPRAGLAAKAADKLRGAGWQIRSTGNHAASDAGTVVYYGRSTLRATAEAVAKQLGGGRSKESADFGSERVTVILGSDFTP